MNITCHSSSVQLRIILFFPLTLFTCNLALAGPGPEAWTVLETSGSPRYSVADDQWQAVKAGMTLPDGAVVETAAGDQARLSHAGDTVSVYPNSRIALRAQRGLLTSVIQYLGEVLFQVEKIEDRRFEVNTPYMIAGVKGTTFGVTVSDDSVTTYLLDGRLTVTGARSGMHTELTAGHFARLGESSTHIRSGAIPPDQRRHWSERSTASDARRDLPTDTPEAPGQAVRDARLGAPTVGLDRSAAAHSRLRTDARHRRPPPSEVLERAVRTERRALEKRLSDKHPGTGNGSGRAPVTTPHPSANSN